jgi:aldose 1-epimerase
MDQSFEDKRKSAEISNTTGADAKILIIRSDSLEVGICPEVGASIEALRYNLNQEWVDVMRPTPKEAIDHKRPGNFSSFHLVPYSNRIENGLLHFKGESYQLKINGSDGHTIHGAGWEHSWKVLSCTEQEIRVGLDSRDIEDINWPFPFSSIMIFRVEGNVFTMDIMVKNEGQETMPVGFGTHPYFSKKLTEEDDRVIVKLPVKGLYPGDTPIPAGAWVNLPPELDFSTERALDNAQFVDNCFRAAPGSTVIKWPGSGVTMTMEADDVYENIILYTPLGKDFFAIEPVTNCNNGFNMAEKGIQDTGTLYLKPGQEAGGEIRIKITHMTRIN